MNTVIIKWTLSPFMMLTEFVVPNKKIPAGIAAILTLALIAAQIIFWVAFFVLLVTACIYINSSIINLKIVFGFILVAFFVIVTYKIIQEVRK